MHVRLLQGGSFYGYCGHCGTPITGKPCGQIHRDGPRTGPAVPLCARCAGPSVTVSQIWARISVHAKHAPDRSLN